MGRRALALLACAACGDNVHPDGGALLLVPEQGLRTSESGGTATFTVELAEHPGRELVVALESTDPAEGTVSPATLTFGPGDIEPKTVTVTGVDDDRADGDTAYAVRVDGGVLGASEIAVVNADDDEAGFRVSPVFGLMTSEVGGQAGFTVRLRSRPAAVVTIPLSSSDPSEGMPNVSTLSFTETNWDHDQMVIVSGLQDTVADGSVTYRILLGAATSTDAAYTGLDPDDVELVNIDDDLQGVVVVPTSGLATTEAGGQAMFQVVLQVQPTANVTIALGSSDTTEASVSTGLLTFTPATWSTPQLVRVTGVNDFVDDGDQPFTIVLANSVSVDPGYNNRPVDDVTGTNTDDDTAGFTVRPSSLVTYERGGREYFTVALTSQPSGLVRIPIAAADPTEGTVSTSQLQFTTTNWFLPQTVTVIGRDDLFADGHQTYTVALSPATSTDSQYAGSDPPDVTVTNIDDEIAGITVTPTSGLLVSELAGDTDAFTIVLETMPLSNVTVPLASNDVSEGTLAVSSVTFTPFNWNVPRTITVSGVNDSLTDGNVPFTIVTGLSSSSFDPRYQFINAADVAVINIDDETAQVYVKAPPRVIVRETGTTATFRMRLTRAPTAPVTCTLASSDLSEATVSPTSIVFSPGNFGFRDVFVTGVNDPVQDGDQLVAIVTAACTSTDTRYNGLDPADVTVLNLDND